MSGPNCTRLFSPETGGHRWHRVSPTEKRGRVHSSTVTVAVLPAPREGSFQLDMKDVEITAFRGSGKGGQHRNKVETAIRVVHKPSGTTVTICNERSQQANKEEALHILMAKLANEANTAEIEKRNKIRRAQTGSGERADKIRTVRCHQGYVQCERTGLRKTLKQYLDGDIKFD